MQPRTILEVSSNGVSKRRFNYVFFQTWIFVCNSVMITCLEYDLLCSSPVLFGFTYLALCLLPIWSILKEGPRQRKDIWRLCLAPVLFAHSSLFPQQTAEEQLETTTKGSEVQDPDGSFFFKKEVGVGVGVCKRKW